MDYHVVWIAQKDRDGGLDLLAQGGLFGVKGPRIKGQVKQRDRWSRAIARRPEAHH